MKWIIFFSFFTQTALAATGCLKDAQLNAAVIREMQGRIEPKPEVKCENFPEILQIDSLTVYKAQDIILYEEDVNRLVKLEELDISNNDNDFVVNLQGNISFPNLTSIIIQNGVKKIDDSNGKFKFEKLEQVELAYYPGFWELITSGQISSEVGLDLTIVKGQEVHLDFRGYTFHSQVKIYGAKSIKNLNCTKKTRRLEIYGGDNFATEISNLKFTGMALDLGRVVFLDFQPLQVSWSLDLTDIKVEVPFVTPDSKITYLSMKNSSIVLPGSEVVANVDIISLKHSTVKGAVIPVGGLKFYIYVVDGTVTLDHLPDSSLSKIKITGDVTFLNQNKALVITKDTQTVLLAIPKLKQLNIDLQDPSSLSILNILDSPLVRIEILHQENISKLPAYFRMLVDKKPLAKKMRKIFKTKAVGFISE